VVVVAMVMMAGRGMVPPPPVSALAGPLSAGIRADSANSPASRRPARHSATTAKDSGASFSVAAAKASE